MGAVDAAARGWEGKVQRSRGRVESWKGEECEGRMKVVVANVG